MLPQVHNKMMLLRSKLWSDEEPICGANIAHGIPLGSQNRGQGMPKWKKIQKWWPKCVNRAILGWPGASPRGSSGDFGRHFGCQSPAVGDFGHHFVVRLAARTSRFLIVVATSFFSLIWSSFFIDFGCGIWDGFSCFPLQVAPPFRAWFWYVFSSRCGSPSVSGKLRRNAFYTIKTKVFYTFNVFRELQFLM